MSWKPGIASSTSASEVWNIVKRTENALKALGSQHVSRLGLLKTTRILNALTQVNGIEHDECDGFMQQLLMLEDVNQLLGEILVLTNKKPAFMDGYKESKYG